MTYQLRKDALRIPICSTRLTTRRRLLYVLVALLLLSGARGLAQTNPTPVAAPQKLASTFSYKIIAGANGTFGYDIYRSNRLQIHQPNIPALPGNNGFQTKVAAEKVAKLVVSKMERGETLPTVSVAEMKKLGAISESVTETRF